MREAHLRYVVALLLGDAPAMKDALASLDAQTKKADRYLKERLRGSIRTMQAGMLRRADSLQPEGTLVAFRKTLEMQQKNNAPGEIRIDLPDLSTLTDTNEAQNLIDQTLAITNVIVEVPAGPETRALVQRRIVARIDRIGKPQWDMVCTANASGVALYEALERKFGGKTNEEDNAMPSRFMNANSQMYRPEEYERGNNGRAKYYYVFGLLAAGRRDDAVKFALAMGPHEMEWTSRHESQPVDSDTLFAFVDELFHKRPELKLWQQYAALALETGKTNEAASWIEKNEPAKFTTATQFRDVDACVNAYLTLDEIPRAVALMRKVLDADTRPLPGDVQSQAMSTRISLALRLAQIGKLVKNPAWVREGLAAAMTICRQGWTSSLASRYGGSFYESERIVKELVDQQEYEAAEAFVLSSMEAKKKAMANQPYDNGNPDAHAEELAILLRIYAAAGRSADVVNLLDQAPWWGVADLASMHNGGGCGEQAIEPLVASALHDVGRNADAAGILKTYLYTRPGDDDGYRVLTAIEGPALIPWLETLYARDRFEERPLIWKAWLLMKEGKLDDAEQTVREAIKVDPTDGEEKAGDRVRAYAVLGDILEAKGKKEDATFFHNVVKSVRIAEEGDQFTQAGLITRSLPLYEKAQGLFANAYCIQWRMAERLGAIGKTSEAAEHYKIAFERMPEQFGQVASFCFGCEGVFRSGNSRSAAERVLTGLEKDGPKRPQVYYLLGQLRESQERLTDSYAYYKKATEMDPGYLDAWEKLAGLSQRLFLSQAERDALSLRMLALDPVQRHACVSVSEVYDFKGLWNAVAANQKYAWKAPKTIYPLKASAAKLDEDRKKAGTHHRGYDYMEYGWQNYRENLLTPGRAVSENETVRQIISLMGSFNAGEGEGEVSSPELFEVE